MPGGSAQARWSYLLSPSTHKKVVVRKMDKEVLRGYVNPHAFAKDDGIEVLSISGQLSLLPYGDVKAVYFVRDFDGDVEHAERKVFTSRPKADGLWLRMKFKDDEILDGILPNNLLLLLEERGFTVVPPDPYANNQRIFVPKSSLVELQVLGVIGNPLRKQRVTKAAASQDQIRLFEP